MRQILSLLLLSFLAFTNAQSQVRNDDFFPLSVGNQWTYDYSTSEWDQLGDLIYSDTGSAVCSIISKYTAGDSTIWGFRETRNIVQHVHHTYPPIYDTSFSIIDTTLFGVVEYLNGNHLLVRIGSLNWKSVYPITQQFADSATIFRYSPVLSDTLTLKAQYPKTVSKPYFMLLASFKRLIGPTRISYSAPYITGDVPVSNHVLKRAVLTSIDPRITNSVPDNFELRQNFPNPFNPVTIIPFSIANRTKATIRIYDLLGRHISTIFDKVVDAGNYHAIWNAAEQSSGTYICVLRSSDFSKSIKLVLLK